MLKKLLVGVGIMGLFATASFAGALTNSADVTLDIASYSSVSLSCTTPDLDPAAGFTGVQNWTIGATLVGNFPCSVATTVGALAGHTSLASLPGYAIDASAIDKAYPTGFGAVSTTGDITITVNVANYSVLAGAYGNTITTTITPD